MRSSWYSALFMMSHTTLWWSQEDCFHFWRQLDTANLVLPVHGAFEDGREKHVRPSCVLSSCLCFFFVFFFKDNSRDAKWIRQVCEMQRFSCFVETAALLCCRLSNFVAIFSEYSNFTTYFFLSDMRPATNLFFFLVPAETPGVSYVKQHINLLLTCSRITLSFLPSPSCQQAVH